MTVYAMVMQEVDIFAVGGDGMLEVECSDGPVPFTLPLSGNGILVPGEVDYFVQANGSSEEMGRRYGEARGQMMHAGTVDLGRSPGDGGPLAVTVDPVAGSSGGELVARGTVTCSGSHELAVGVTGWQQAGQHQIPLRGTGSIRCDGAGSVVDFAVPFTSSRAELVPGEAVVTISVTPSGWAGLEPSTRTVTMTFQDHTREPIIGVNPNGSSTVGIGTVTRIADKVVMVQTLIEPCSVGESFHLRASIRPQRPRYLDRWWNMFELSRSAERTIPCTGRPIEAFVGVDEVLEFDELYVRVEVYPSTPGGPVMSWNEAAATVSTK